jgi:hypothetical protein
MSTTKKRPLSYGNPSLPDPAWVAPTEDAMRKLSLLRENWDTYGAPRIDPAMINAALTLLQQVMRSDTPAPSVVPTSRGGVQLEWHTKGIDMELEFLTPAHSHLMFDDQRTSTAWEAEITSDLSQFAQAIALLSRP